MHNANANTGAYTTLPFGVSHRQYWGSMVECDDTSSLDSAARQLEEYLNVNLENELILKFPLPIISASLDTLDTLMHKVCQKLQLYYRSITSGCESKSFLVRRASDSFNELRVAVTGNVDAGKSTMLGVLTHCTLDDGRGKARTGLFRHKHELESGRTSSIGQEILGFEIDGKIVERTKKVSSEDICKQSFKLITFLDLAGHEKYLKTTMFGLAGCSPDYVMMMVGANAGMIGMAKEHLFLAFALNVPVFCVITKIDMCPADILSTTQAQLFKILKSSSCKRVPLVIKSEEDVLFAVTHFSDRICPIFLVSNVVGTNIDLLKIFLNLLPVQGKYMKGEEFEFPVTEIYSVPGVGTVVAGTVTHGWTQTNQNVLLGPDFQGNFTKVQIKSTHRKRLPAIKAAAGQCASFALKKIKKASIRKGMMLLSTSYDFSVGNVCIEFEAEVLVLFHSTTISPKYQAMIHCGAVRQAATIVDLFSKERLRTGDRALVRFKFLKFPEFMKLGSRLLFREGRTKGVGKITKLIPLKTKTQ